VLVVVGGVGGGGGGGGFEDWYRLKLCERLVDFRRSLLPPSSWSIHA